MDGPDRAAPTMVCVGDCGGFVRQRQASPSATGPDGTSSTRSIRLVCPRANASDSAEGVDQSERLQLPVEPERSDEAQRTRIWRHEQFVALGFDFARAELAGWDVRIADAQRARALAPLACKTDRIDAQVLAELARRELVPEVWLPDPRVRGERERARFRLHLVMSSSSMILRACGEVRNAWSLCRMRQPVGSIVCQRRSRSLDGRPTR
jgi:hypothetical protein